MIKKICSVILLVIIMVLPERGYSSSTLTMVFLTDIHSDGSEKIFREIKLMARRVNRENPEVIIGGGDLIAGGLHFSKGRSDREWQSLYAMRKLFTVPFYSAIGNHDFSPSSWKKGALPVDHSFKRFTGQKHSTYMKQIKGYYFLFLNSVTIPPKGKKYRCHISPEHLKEVKRLLSIIPRKAPLVVVSHVPLFSSYIVEGGFVAKSKRVDNYEEFYKLISKHTVIAILQGHLHLKEKVYHRGILHITGGAVSGAWWQGAHHGTEEGFYRITLTGKEVTATYIGYRETISSAKRSEL